VQTVNGSAARRAVVLLVTFLALSVATAQARPLFFRYTAIADTKDRLFEELNFPCINDLSLIAFSGRFSTHVEGLFSRHNLGGFNTLADSASTPYESFDLDCSINHNAMIEIGALQKVSNGFNNVILRGTGNSVTPLVDTTGTYNELNGYQLNLVGKTVLSARRASDDAAVLLVKGVGILNGPERIIVPGTGAVSQFSFPLTDPVINSSGTVAYAATKNQNGSLHLITVTESGLVTELLDDSGPFAGISNVILNDVGSMAFGGVLAGGEGGVWRLDLINDRWNLTQLASSRTLDCIEFTPVAMNDLTAVTFGCLGTSMVYSAYLSDAQGLHQLASPGTQMLGRTAAQTIISRESVNSDEQIALHVDFDDGTSAIVRVDPTFIPPWLQVVLSGAFELTTTSGGGGAGITTSVNTPTKLLLLSFDLTFPSQKGGELRVTLGDKLLKSFDATLPGIRQHVRIPIDLRRTAKGAPGKARSSLRFEITGGRGGAVQISNVMIPGVISDSMRSNAGHRWHIDTSKGGRAGPVDTTAFPVGIQVAREAMGSKRPAPVAILSSAGFDATHDIIRTTITVNGQLLSGTAKKGEAASEPHCLERDVNADKLPDLVCDVMLTDSSVRVEALTINGWSIAGSATPGQVVSDSTGH
jgi:hypothetical protein